MTSLLAGGARLTWSEARQSPCASCQAAYCCTHALVHRFQLRSLIDVDFAQYLLNFEGIVLGLDEEMGASVYLNQACSYLDTDAGLCTVHGSDLQPAECRHYPAFDCQYRRRMDHGNDSQHPLLDRARFEWMASRLLFDEERNLVAGPTWSETLAGLEAIPLGRSPAPQPPLPPTADDWHQVVFGRPERAGQIRPARYQDDAVQSPCTGCLAYCCEVLAFDQVTPASVADLEHLRFLLGFPSVELAVGDDDWKILVHVRCRHLDGTQCSVFGQPDRPLHCSALPAVGCGYKPMFSEPDPDRQLRLRKDLFPVLENAIAFTGDGRILGIPPVPLINRFLQEAEGSTVR